MTTPKNNPLLVRHADRASVDVPCPSCGETVGPQHARFEATLPRRARKTRKSP